MNESNTVPIIEQNVGDESRNVHSWYNYLHHTVQEVNCKNLVAFLLQHHTVSGKSLFAVTDALSIQEEQNDADIEEARYSLGEEENRKEAMT